MTRARRLKFAIVACVLCALALVASSMVSMAVERHRLTDDPLALRNAAEIGRACDLLLERSLERGGSHIESRYVLKQTMLKLRDGWDGVPAADAHALLADIYDRVAARVTAKESKNTDEVLAVLSEARPTSEQAALWERYQQALAKHGIAAASAQ